MQHRSVLCSLVIVCAGVLGACGTEPAERCSVAFRNSPIGLGIGVSVPIGAVAQCSGEVVPVVTYTSSAPDVIQVDPQSGVVTALKLGGATITASVRGRSATATGTVEV